MREAQVVASRRAVYLLLVCALSPDGRLSGVRSAADLRRHAILPPTPPNEACFGSRSIACPRLLRVLWCCLASAQCSRRGTSCSPPLSLYAHSASSACHGLPASRVERPWARGGGGL